MNPQKSTEMFAVVLAGGRSSRMGQDKALLVAPNGETLLQRALTTARSALAGLGGNVEDVWISGDYPQIAPSIIDRIPGFGPLSGLHAALCHALEQIPSAEVALFIPVDMPELDISILYELVQQLRNNPVHVAAHYEGQEFPLALRASRLLRDQFARLLSSAAAGEKDPTVAIHRVLRELEPLVVSCIGNESIFSNLNTGSEFASWSSRDEH